MNRNIALYNKIPVNVLTSTATSTSLYNLIDASNTDYKKSLDERNKTFLMNSFRVYVHSGTLGIMLDGSVVTQTTHLGVGELQHFIENCDLELVSFAGIGGDAVFTLQIAHIG